MKKLIRALKWFFALLVIACTGLWLGGYGYIFRAVSMTYLVGQTGPGIDEKESFYNDTLSSADDSAPWSEHPNTSDLKLTPSLEAKMKEIQTAGFLVIQDEKILYEQYWDGFTKHHTTNSFSAAKSIVSLLIGIAVEEGFIRSIDDSAGDYLEGFKLDGKENITIRNLLTMSSGLNWTESGANPFSNTAEAYYGYDLVGLIDRLSVDANPGIEFKYQSGNTQILGFILEAATKQSISSYAERVFWNKIGAVHDAYWNLDDENGKAKAFCCFYATPRDFARVGQLILNNGVWNNEQVVPSAYVDECFVPADLTDKGKSLDRYGLHWWILNYNGIDVRYARGIFGQYIIVLPEKNLVIVRTGKEREQVNGGGHPADIYYYLDAALDITEQVNA